MRYTRLRRDHIQETIDCVVQTFLYDEPMTKVLDITEEEFIYFAKIICDKMVVEGNSYVCVNNSKVVGFCLNEDLITSPPKGIEIVTEKMNPIFQILEGLNNRYLKTNPKKKNKYFHMFMAGSKREYRNKGIVKELIRISLNYAKEKRYKRAVAEATNIKSLRLLIDHFGFEELYSTNYKKYAYKNKRVFGNIGEESCKLVELVLNKK